MHKNALVILFWVGVVFTLLAPISLSVCGHDNAAWTALLSGAFVTLVSRIQDITEIAVGPVKAKMREIIDEARATIAQLQTVATASSKATLTSLISESFLAQHPFLERLEMKKQIIAGLSEIGVSEEDIHNVEENWKRGVARIFYRRLVAMFETDGKEAHDKAYQEMKGLLESNKPNVVSPQQYIEALERLGGMNDERQAWINDYEHFLETGEIRRTELWEDE